MSLLKKNIIANFSGSMWQAFMALIFIPFYIEFMGIESWGLIGIFATLQIIFGLLDMGLSATLNREMARLSVLPRQEQQMRNLVRTLEILYWSIAVLVGITIVTLSPFFAHNWVKAGQLSPNTIEHALIIMGIVVAFQMPIGFYSGGLIGLQRQVLLNVINMSMSTLRGVGAVLVLWLVSPTIQAFFLWQIIVCTINTFLLAFFLWRSLPLSSKKASFQKDLFRGIWRFATGMGGITILAVILTQLDKIILSKMLSLEMFGYYTLASVVAMSLNRLIFPVFTGIYPRFTQLVSLNDQEGLKHLYNKSSQLMSVLILPVAIVVAFFSYEILLLWSQNPLIAEKTHLLVSIMICGTALNGIMNLPYALQLAFGWTKIGLNITTFLLIIFIPSIIILTKYFGPLGAAIAWLALNIFYMAIGVPLTHRRLLKGEAKKWCYNILLPVAGILATVLTGRYLFNSFLSPTNLILPISTIYLCALFSAVILSKHIRELINFKFLRGKALC